MQGERIDYKIGSRQIIQLELTPKKLRAIQPARWRRIASPVTFEICVHMAGDLRRRMGSLPVLHKLLLDLESRTSQFVLAMSSKPLASTKCRNFFNTD